jgi:hypothetical protein
MPSKLYQFRIKRTGEEIALAHVIAPTEEDAHQFFLDREFTLGLANEWFAIERVDRQLPGDERDGLAPLLKSTPTCLASHNPIAGWLAHVAPVHRLRLYRSLDYRGTEILAAAPNEDVAKTIYNTTQFAAVHASHQWFVEEMSIEQAVERSPEIERLLEGEQIGIVDYDEELERWFVW